MEERKEKKRKKSKTSGTDKTTMKNEKMKTGTKKWQYIHVANITSFKLKLEN